MLKGPNIRIKHAYKILRVFDGPNTRNKKIGKILRINDRRTKCKYPN